MKIEDLKFFECPLSCITPQTWRLMALVNETTNADGDFLNINHLPQLVEQVQAQELKYREAVRIVKGERHSEWNRDLQRERAKRKAGK